MVRKYCRHNESINTSDVHGLLQRDYFYIMGRRRGGRHGKKGRRHHHKSGFRNYYYIPGEGSGVFSPSVFAWQVRNISRLPGMLPIVTSKDGHKRIQVQKYTVLNTL